MRVEGDVVYVDVARADLDELVCALSASALLYISLTLPPGSKYEEEKCHTI